MKIVAYFAARLVNNFFQARTYPLALIALAIMCYDVVTSTYGLYIIIPLVFVIIERMLVQLGSWFTREATKEIVNAAIRQTDTSFHNM